MSDESTPELQYVARARNWRQRYAGPEGEYVYRKNITVRGVDTKVRRVQAGERVDCEADGISPRRLKALWYSETIELADESARVPRALKKNIIDNRAIRLEEARISKQEDAKLEAKRLKRRELNALRIEADAQRTLAERAVVAAELQERREIEDLIRADEDAAREVKIQELLKERAKVAADDAELEQELVAEQTQIRIEREEAARVAQIDTDAKRVEEQGRLEGETLERIAERQAVEESRQAPPTEESSTVLDNTQETLSAQEAKDALKGD